MPELPEVETVRRSLLTVLPGKEITSVEVLRKESVGYPSATKFSKSLVGHRFVDIFRRGKYLVFELDKGAHLVAHLRMSGRLLVGSKPQREDHVRVRVALKGGHVFLFEDMRVFGRLWYVSKNEKVDEIVTALALLGVEPLEALTPEYLKETFANRKQPIKSALLDQTAIAGIGNIYADESLHLSGIHPQRSACDIKAGELESLCESIKHVLSQAIAARGSTLRNYSDSQGINGNYQNKALVYGRTGENCRQCSTEIARIKLAGRSSHFCPNCQPKSGKRKAKTR